MDLHRRRVLLRRRAVPGVLTWIRGGAIGGRGGARGIDRVGDGGGPGGVQGVGVRGGDQVRALEASGAVGEG